MCGFHLQSDDMTYILTFNQLQTSKQTNKIKHDCYFKYISLTLPIILINSVRSKAGNVHSDNVSVKILNHPGPFR